MKVYTHEEMLDKVLGEKGTPRRNQYESDMSAFLAKLAEYLFADVS